MPAADEGEDVIGEAADGGGLLRSRAGAETVAEDAETAVEEDAEIDVGGGAGGDADAHEAAQRART